MFDPITISASLSVASMAFSNVKRMFQAGRDLETMSQDLSRWMGAVSDIDNAEKSAKNPTMFRKVFGGGSVEQEAIEYLIMKDIPEKVWREYEKSNKPRLVICRKEQLPQQRTWRNAWKIAA